MGKQILLILFLGLCSCSSQKSTSIATLDISEIQQGDFRIKVLVPGYLEPMKQPKSLDCWLTVTTMMYAWKQGQPMTLADVSKELGEPWNSLYLSNKGLPYEDKENFINQVGFNSEPPANHMIEAYVGWLKSHGPIWVTTSSKPNGMSAHAKLLIGVYGDGSYEKTFFRFIDPAKGMIITQTALRFSQEFENEARYFVSNPNLADADFRIQVIHW